MRNITDKIIGDRLRQLRVNSGYSQEYVAEKVCCSRATISRKESGKRSIQAIEIAKFAALYQVPPEYFY